MKVVVNRGQTVVVAVRPGIEHQDGRREPPVIQKHGPTTLLELPDDEAKSLIARGVARAYEELKTAESESL
jgi:hypothetical protein